MKSHPVLVLGMGCSGRAAARYLLHQGEAVVGVDANLELLASDPEIRQLKNSGLKTLHESSLKDLKGFAYLVRSPGILPTHPLLREASASGLEILGEVELACRSLCGQRVLAVTGTNGKTTVTLLTAHVLNASGYPAKAVGNIGVAFCEVLDKGLGDEILVMELSSYQLESLSCRVIDAGVILNITPDHLDWHGDMQSYARAKFQLGSCLKPTGKLWIQQQAAYAFQPLLQGVIYEPFAGLGDHHSENEQAAWKLCQAVGISQAQFQSACQTFKRPSHRIEFVRECAGIRYFDDSKGTNIDAVVKAVASIDGPIVLIAGGVDKGFSYTSWITDFRGKVKAIYAIGQAAVKIWQEIGHAIPVELAPTLESAVQRATATACSGESVLLSPGCASFDMFRDYAHRGEEFQKFVWVLSDGEAR